MCVVFQSPGCRTEWITSEPPGELTHADTLLRKSPPQETMRGYLLTAIFLLPLVSCLQRVGGTRGAIGT